MTSILERRRIEAELARALLGAMEKVMPREQALSVLGETVVQMARAAGASAARELGRVPSLADFAALLPRWQQDDALAIDFLTQTPDRLEFNVTRCRYADMYRELGVLELGTVLSCSRDGEFCRGYDPDISMERSRTIMQGATHCDFRYRMARSNRDSDRSLPSAD
jgi:hypothetical protein